MRYLAGGMFLLGVLGLWLQQSIRIEPTETAPLPPPPEAARAWAPSFRMKFAGDVMLGRHVRTLAQERGPEFPLRSIADWLRDADLTLVNLEGPIMAEAPVTPINSLKFAFLPEAAALLAEAGVDAVSLGNNHAYDQGAAGYAETIRHLSAAGISSFGHPLEANDTAFLRRESAAGPVTFLGFNATWPSFAQRESEALALAEREAAAGTVVVFMHWGDEYELRANDAQRKLAREFIDRGADLVLGHHPHVVQDAEIYRDRLVFYSLGNFVFDQYFSRETQEGLALTATLGEDGGWTVDLMPVTIERSEPRPMAEPERSAFLEALAERSAPPLAEGIRQGVLKAGGSGRTE